MLLTCEFYRPRLRKDVAMPRERSARGWFIVFAVAAFLLYCTLGATGQRPAQKVLNITVGDYSIEQTAKAKDVVVARLGKPGMPVLSFEAMAESDWAKLTKDAASDQPMQAERSYRILSAVGPFLSVRKKTTVTAGERILHRRNAFERSTLARARRTVRRH